MKNVLFIGFITLLTISCRKDVRIEKNLWKNGGKWDIVSLKEDAIGETGESDHSYYENCGYFHFKKDGTGVLVYTVPYDPTGDAFVYTNTDDRLTLIFDGEGHEYKLDWKKNKFTITMNETWQGSDDYGNPINIDYTVTMNCEKK